MFLHERDGSVLLVSRTLQLPSQQNVRQLAANAGLCYAVGDSGTAYLFDVSCLPLQPVPLPLPRQVRITQLSCNDFAVLLVTNSGQVYAQGSDPANSGFLAGMTEALSPTLLPGLLDVAIKQTSLGPTHAAALDSNSSLS